MSSKYSHWSLGATVTRQVLLKKLSVLGDSKKGGFLEQLIINQSSEYKWKLDTTAHMVKRWTNRLIVGAQMGQMGLLPRTTGIQRRLKKGIVQFQVNVTVFT